MNKGISLYFGYVMQPELYLKMISDAHFDCVITSADKRFNKQNGTIKQQINNIKNNNLKVSSLHMRYKNKDLPYFWKKGIKGFILTQKLIKDVKIAHKYNFSCVVVHLFGTPSNIGLTRLQKVLKVCNKLNVDLALENIDDNTCLNYTFENITDSHLKFCYDSGHNNVWDKDVDYLSKYLNKVVALHLHDNNGLKDQHTLYGNVNWDRIAQNLAKLDHDISLDYEMLMVFKNNETPKEVLDVTYKKATELEKLIKKYKMNK